MLRRTLKWVVFFGFLLGGWQGVAQSAPTDTLAGALRSLAARAGVVFAGEVVAVRRLGGVVEVEFQVDEIWKGNASGKLVLREWGGLWAAGQRRYWVGERAVMFLHAAKAGRLGSAVDGMDGVLPLSSDGVALSVDVRRLQTTVLRDAGAPMGDLRERLSLAEVAAVVDEVGKPPVIVGVPVSVGRPVSLEPAREPVREPVRSSVQGVVIAPVRLSAMYVEMVEVPNALGMDDDPEQPALKRDDKTSKGGADGH